MCTTTSDGNTLFLFGTEEECKLSLSKLLAITPGSKILLDPQGQFTEYGLSVKAVQELENLYEEGQVIVCCTGDGYLPLLNSRLEKKPKIVSVFGKPVKSI